WWRASTTMMLMAVSVGVRRLCRDGGDGDEVMVGNGDCRGDGDDLGAAVPGSGGGDDVGDDGVQWRRCNDNWGG
nr:hypothetical protein [Tanacetum cinerariifolium]